MNISKFDCCCGGRAGGLEFSTCTSDVILAHHRKLLRKDDEDRFKERPTLFFDDDDEIVTTHTQLYKKALIGDYIIFVHKTGTIAEFTNWFIMEDKLYVVDKRIQLLFYKKGSDAHVQINVLSIVN